MTVAEDFWIRSRARQKTDAHLSKTSTVDRSLSLSPHIPKFRLHLVTMIPLHSVHPSRYDIQDYQLFIH